MSTTLAVVDRIKSVHHIESDYAVAKLLGVTKQSVSYYRNKGSQFDANTAVKAAKLAEIDPLKLLASLHSEKSANDEESKLWKDIESMSETVKQLNTKEYNEALTALLDGKATEKQKALIKKVQNNVYYVKLPEIPKTATFSPIYQNIPKKHLN